jgi:cytochrome c-type biogenesis protein CcmH/NrfG
LAVLRSSMATGGVDQIALTVPELRRLLSGATGSAVERAHRERWSTWRRRHQAQAQRSHSTRRPGLTFLAGLVIPAATLLAGLGALTTGRWAQIAPVLPRRQAHKGQPVLAEQSLLEAMLWVMQTGVAWRAIPAAMGPWHTVYTRYQQWVKELIWQRVVGILGSDTTCSARAEVSL